MATKKTRTRKAQAGDEEVRKVRRTKKAAEESVKKTTKKSETKAPAKRARKTAGKWEAPKHVWQAPEGLKTGFPIQITFRTEKDGMPGGAFRVLRFKGRYDPEADESKVFDMANYDRWTQQAVIARISSVLFHPTGRPNKAGVVPRLKPNTIYRLVGRVGVRKADDAITARIQTVEIGKRTRRETVYELLDNKDPDARRIRKINKHLPAAFRNLQELPEVPRRRRKAEEDED